MGALEAAISNPNHNVKQIIFADYKPIINWINKEEKQVKYRDRYQDPLRSYKNRINKILNKNRASTNCNQPEAIWIPSHSEEKLANSNTKPEKKTRILAQLEYLTSRFGEEGKLAIIKGNNAADLAAKNHLKNYQPNHLIYKGHSRFVLLKDKKPVEGSISHLLSKRWQEKNHQDREKPSPTNT